MNIYFNYAVLRAAFINNVTRQGHANPHLALICWFACTAESTHSVSPAGGASSVHVQMEHQKCRECVCVREWRQESQHAAPLCSNANIELSHSFSPHWGPQRLFVFAEPLFSMLSANKAPTWPTIVVALPLSRFFHHPTWPIHYRRPLFLYRKCTNSNKITFNIN